MCLQLILQRKPLLVMFLLRHFGWELFLLNQELFNKLTPLLQRHRLPLLTEQLGVVSVLNSLTAYLRLASTNHRALWYALTSTMSTDTHLGTQLASIEWVLWCHVESLTHFKGGGGQSMVDHRLFLLILDRLSPLSIDEVILRVVAMQVQIWLQV